MRPGGIKPGQNGQLNNGEFADQGYSPVTWTDALAAAPKWAPSKVKVKKGFDTDDKRNRKPTDAAYWNRSII